MAALGGATDGIEPDRHCMPCGRGAGGIDDILCCEEIIEKTMAEAQACCPDSVSWRVDAKSIERGSTSSQRRAMIKP